MNRKRLAVLLFTALILLAGVAPIAASPTLDYALVSHTIDSGGTLETGEERFTLSGTVGQHDASTEHGEGRFALTGGYWGPRSDNALQVFLPLINK